MLSSRSSSSIKLLISTPPHPDRPHTHSRSGECRRVLHSTHLRALGACSSRIACSLRMPGTAVGGLGLGVSCPTPFPSFFKSARDVGVVREKVRLVPLFLAPFYSGHDLP